MLVAKITRTGVGVTWLNRLIDQGWCIHSRPGLRFASPLHSPRGTIGPPRHAGAHLFPMRYSRLGRGLPFFGLPLLKGSL